ncbi:HNH endonuclease [uncultured Piscinibacter sp.]|uniref:HNH endonuclease n=1 Tax=uncultured Piscinibacter sp. TaxID=1131835 RepID=UPI00345BEF8E
MKQLDRLLFEQGGECFFCKQPLARADASIEHLLAQANGGNSAEENVVACCKAINSLLSNKPLKEKFSIILRQKHGFQCPAKAGAQEPANTQLAPVAQVSPQHKVPVHPKPPAKPRSPATPKASAAQKAPISSAGIIALTRPSPPITTAPGVTPTLVHCPTCHHTVPAAVGQSDYVCPHCKGAFRY